MISKPEKFKLSYLEHKQNSEVQQLQGKFLHFKTEEMMMVIMLIILRSDNVQKI